jgi:type I restriction enzyme M protein
MAKGKSSPSSTVAKKLIPQATLARIRAVIDAVVAGAGTMELVQHATGLPARHAAYAVDAAEALELVSRGDGRAIEPTSLGRQLAESAAESDEELATWHATIDASSVIAQIAPGLLGEQPPKAADIVKRITAVTGLGGGTAEHRAAMILKWRKQLLTGPKKRVPTRKSLDGGGMWRRIEIRNYRSIEDASIELSPFALVVGPNGSGKSNFADALVFARDISNDASAAIENRGGIVGVRRWRPTKPTDVAIDIRAAFSQARLDTDYVRHAFKIHSGAQGQFKFTEERIEIVSNGDSKIWLKRAGDSLTRSGGGRLPAVQDTASAMVLAGQLKDFVRTSALRNVRRYRLSPDEMRQPQLSTEKIRLEENGSNIAVAIRDVRKGQRFKDLLRAMAKIVPGLQDVRVQQVGRYLTLKFYQEQEEGLVADFNATEMSEGALRALGIIVATLQMVPDELLIIEEPEVSIHVGAAALLFDVLKEASEAGAVLLTTHSADLLDSARDEAILVCEYTHGITKIGPLSAQQRDVVREGLFSVAELMRSEPLRIETTEESSK